MGISVKVRSWPAAAVRHWHPDDEALLHEFADRNTVVFYLQPQGPATAFRFYPQDGPRMSYLLPDFAVEHYFSPTEFTRSIARSTACSCAVL